MNIFHILFYEPLFNILIFFYNILGHNLGLALIAIAVLARVITIPLTNRQLKSAEKNKEFQQELKNLKNKYKNNEERYKEEAAKLQAKYLPAQLGGCLPLIIIIILLFQLRGAIVDLVNRGWHSFNEVSYISSYKRDEDAIFFKPESELSIGEHELKVYVKANNGNELEKVYKFYVVDDIDQKIDELKSLEKSKSDQEKEDEKNKLSEESKTERASEIAIYNKVLEEHVKTVVVKSFLILPTETIKVYILDEKQPELNMFMRAPSGETLVAQETKVYLDGNDVTSISRITQGEPVNLKLFGLDMSKVAIDYPWSSSKIIPYVLLAVLVGITQLVSTQIMTSFGGKKETEKKSETSKKKKDKKEGEPDMEEIMSSVNKQMMFTLPILTVVTSLGYLGGARFFPSGISLYWTVQNAFVIIQRLVNQREEVIKFINNKFIKKTENGNSNTVKKNN